MRWRSILRRGRCRVCSVLLAAGGTLQGGELAESATSRAAAERVRPGLERALAKLDLRFGDPVHMRVFKESGEFELWVRHRESGDFRLFRIYKIARHSGGLGPKLREGDRQAVEGFYQVAPGAMNPDSRFHLSFDLGYPNAYDRAHDRSGSYLMVHGDRVSIGCFAMTDRRIEEIYTLAAAALAKGQPTFRVDCFPFRMTAERMQSASRSPWLPFWQNLKQGDDIFERTRRPPKVRVQDKRYVFDDR